MPNTQLGIRPVSFRRCRCKCLKHVAHHDHYLHKENCPFLNPPEGCTVIGLRRCNCSTCDCLCAIHFIERAQLVTHTDHFKTKADTPPPEDAPPPEGASSGPPSLEAIEDEFLATLAAESPFINHPLLEFIRSAPPPGSDSSEEDWDRDVGPVSNFVIPDSALSYRGGRRARRQRARQRRSQNRALHLFHPDNPETTRSQVPRDEPNLSTVASAVTTTVSVSTARPPPGFPAEPGYHGHLLPAPTHVGTWADASGVGHNSQDHTSSELSLLCSNPTLSSPLAGNPPSIRLATPPSPPPARLRHSPNRDLLPLQPIPDRAASHVPSPLDDVSALQTALQRIEPSFSLPAPLPARNSLPGNSPRDDPIHHVRASPASAGNPATRQSPGSHGSPSLMISHHRLVATSQTIVVHDLSLPPPSYSPPSPPSIRSRRLPIGPTFSSPEPMSSLLPVPNEPPLSPASPREDEPSGSSLPPPVETDLAPPPPVHSSQGARPKCRSRVIRSIGRGSAVHPLMSLPIGRVDRPRLPPPRVSSSSPSAPNATPIPRPPGPSLPPPIRRPLPQYRDIRYFPVEEGEM